MTGLDEKEQEEMKTLQEERKGQHITDSNRARLSELLKKEDEGKEGATTAAGEKKASAPSSANAPAAGKK